MNLATLETTLREWNQGSALAAPIPLRVVTPEEGEFPTVVVVPSVFGPEQDVTAQTRELAGASAQVVLVDPFWRVHPGALPYDKAGVTAALKRKRETLEGDVQSDLSQVIAACREQPRNNGEVLGLGICFGGRFVWQSALLGEIDAAVLWHAAGCASLLDRVEELTVPLEHHLGDSDPLIPPAEVLAMQHTLGGKDHLVCAVYEGVGHGFTHTSKADAYDEEATRAAMAAVTRQITALR